MSAPSTAPGPDRSGQYQRWSITIDWTLADDARSCTVAVSWCGQLLARKTLDASSSTLTFDARTETSPRPIAAGEIDLNLVTGQLLLVFLQCPEGRDSNVELTAAHPLPPPVPPADADGEPTGQILIEQTGDLFPYIHLNNWPAPSPQALSDRFVFYAGATCGTDDARLFCRLAAVDRSLPGARQAMLVQALAFLDDQPPYEGQRVMSPADLGPAFNLLQRFAKEAAALPLPTVEGVTGLASRLWDLPWQDVAGILLSDEFAARVDHAWQNVFALSCVVGYTIANMEALTACIRAASLLQRLARIGQTERGDAWTPQRLRDGLHATLVLPEPVFPLPPIALDAATTPPVATVLPYAIGELCQVKRRLTGYTLGAISHIENVMADEKKVRSRHDLLTTESQHASHEQQDDVQEIEQEGRRLTLDSQVSAAVREHFQIDYVTQYGPPTESRQTGSYTVAPVGDAPAREALDQDRRLARQLTQRGAQRLSSQLSEQRVQRRHHARRNEVSQCFNRRGRDQNQRGVYRWLDARYQCWIERVGRRVMLEYFVPVPAAQLIAAHRQQLGEQWADPVAPAQLGLLSAADVSLDPASDCYFVTLCARYGVELKEQPPAATAYACASIEAGAALTSQRMALPDGYGATKATLSLATLQTDRKVAGCIGAAAFLLGDPNSTVTVTLDGQTHSLPVSLAPPLDTLPAEPGYGLNIEVDLDCLPAHLLAWKARVYSQVLAAYRRRQTEYLQATGAAPGARVDPQSQQRIIRQSLKRAGQAHLLQRAARSSDDYADHGRLAPALHLWLDAALEWTQMSYTLVDDPQAALSLDEQEAPFTAFLQARCARVLLPVAAEHERSVLYFLASGMVWNGHDAMAPVFESTLEDGHSRLPAAQRYLDLLDALKSVDGVPPAPPSREPWALTLPTDLSILQDGDALPGYLETA